MLSQKRSLQKLDAYKPSGKSPAADVDLVGVFKVVSAFILL